MGCKWWPGAVPPCLGPWSLTLTKEPNQTSPALRQVNILLEDAPDRCWWTKRQLSVPAQAALVLSCEWSDAVALGFLMGRAEVLSNLRRKDRDPLWALKCVVCFLLLLLMLALSSAWIMKLGYLHFILSSFCLQYMAYALGCKDGFLDRASCFHWIKNLINHTCEHPA